MPRRKTDLYWRERIRAMAENPPPGGRLTDRAIASQLESEARRLGRDDSPAERTVGRIRGEYQDLPEAEHSEYRALRWPASMQDGSLPWTASASALELLRAAPKGDRPSIRLARWFWRLGLAVPHAPFRVRRALAGFLSVAEIVGHLTPDLDRAAETFLIYAPWASDKALAAYDQAREAGEVGDLLLVPPVGEASTKAREMWALLMSDDSEGFDSFAVYLRALSSDHLQRGQDGK